MRGSRDRVSAPRGDDLAVLYTVGHSTRPIEELIGLLESAGAARLVDVRTVPRSRRNPQFVQEALSASLAEHEIEYRHEPGLGGFRRPRPGTANAGWEQPAFRGYADYMGTPEFAEALERLEGLARDRSTSIMCAEAQWWRCHRRLVSDALVVRGWEVMHLGLKADAVPHELTPFALVEAGGAISYPPAQRELELEAGGA